MIVTEQISAYCSGNHAGNLCCASHYFNAFSQNSSGLYLHSDHVYLDIVTTEGKKHTVRGSLIDYMNRLSSDFFRTHRSCAINLNHMKKVKHAEVLVADTQLPIGKKQREELMAKLNK